MTLPPLSDDEPEWLQVQRRRNFNGAGLEIWFSRFGWRYIPVHWKGVVVSIAGIVFTLALCFFLDPTVSGTFVIPLLIGTAVLNWICERHSAMRS